MKRWLRDVCLAAGILVVAIIAIVYAIRLDAPRATYLLARADMYMILILGVVCVLSLMLILRALRMKGTEAGDTVLEPLWDKLNIMTALALFVYLLVLEKLGFILSSITLLWLLSFFYTRKDDIVRKGKDYKDKKVIVSALVKTLIFSVIASVVTYYVFTALLGTKLPTFNLF